MKKSLTTGLSVAGLVLFLIYMSMIIKLITLGPVPYASDLGPAFLPFGRIEINPSESFSIQNKIGSIVFPLIAGVVAGAIQYLLQHKRGNNNEVSV